MAPLLLLWGPALAGEPPVASLHGDVKTSFVAGAPVVWVGEAEDPYGQGGATARLKGVLERGPLRLEAHWAAAAQTSSSASAAGAMGSLSGAAAPELLPLTWAPDLGDGLSLQHGVDRLVLSAKLGPVDLALGRQPVSFGAGRIFTPLDLVNPFGPATIDTEYKPGVDALRVDAYAGVSTKVTVVGAWAGAPVLGEGARDPEAPVLDDVVLAASGQTTVGVTDLLGFVGLVRAEPVLGLGTVSALGPVGVHAEASLTLPEGDEGPFVRAVAGADGRPTAKTTLMAELYLQSFGATDPADYLEAVEDPRFQRGEIWQMGQLYGALAVAQEITPLVAANLSVIGNLRDPSALLSAGASWSIADDAELLFGGYLGLGAPPDPVDLAELALDPGALAGSVNSEFGLYPSMGWLQVRTYF